MHCEGKSSHEVVSTALSLAVNLTGARHSDSAGDDKRYIVFECWLADFQVTPILYKDALKTEPTITFHPVMERTTGLFKPSIKSRTG